MLFDIKDAVETTKKVQGKMLVERLPVWALFIIYVFYFALLALAIVGGFFGPQVWDYDTVSAWACPEDSSFDPAICYGSDFGNGESWIGSVSNLNKLNQELMLIAQIENQFASDEIGISKKVQFEISMEAREESDDPWDTIIDAETHKRVINCQIKEKYCDNVTLIFQPFLSFYEYKFNITMKNIGTLDFVGDTLFTFKYVNEYYTIFELWFRFLFLFVSFLSLMALTVGLRHYEWSNWKSEQKWTAILLFGAMAYDNPFFPMEILVRGWFFPFLDQVLTVTFVTLLLFFFIVLMDSIRLHAENIKDVKKYHIFKALLMILIWATCIILWGYVQINDIQDPEYSTGSDIPYFDVFYYTLLVLAGIYVFYLGYIGVRCALAIKTGGKLLRRVQFFALFTFLVIGSAVIGIVFNIYGPTERHASIFLVYIAMFNLYTAILAIFYIPIGTSSSVEYATVSKDTGDDVEIEMQEIIEVSEDAKS